MDQPNDVRDGMEDSNMSVRSLMGGRLRHNVPQVNGYVIGHCTYICDAYDTRGVTTPC